MKSTSIIFLIISGILIVAGILLCFIGSALASGQNIPLYSKQVDSKGLSFDSKTFDSDTTKEINIYAKTADVKIYGNSDSSKIELINFGVNSYTLSTDNDILSLGQSSLDSFLTFDGLKDSILGFSGLRYYIGSAYDKTEPSQINIYLPSDAAATLLKINLGDGNITLSDLSGTASREIQLETGTGDILFENSRASEIYSSVTIKKGNIGCVNSSVNIEASVGNGDINIDLTEQNYLTLTAPDGTITMGGATVKSYNMVYPTEVASPNPDITSMKMSTDNGNIRVDYAAPAEDSSVSTTTETGTISPAA